MYQISRKHPSVSLWLPAPLSGELDETFPERGGGPAKLVEGFFVESSAWCKRFTELPLSQCYALPAPLSGEPNETSPERGGGPSLDGGGVLCGIFCFMYQISRKHPSVSLRLPAPLKGSLYTKGKPIHQRGAYASKGSLNKPSFPFRGRQKNHTKKR